MSLAYEAADAVDKICDTFTADMREQIQAEAKNIFDRLVTLSVLLQPWSIFSMRHQLSLNLNPLVYVREQIP